MLAAETSGRYHRCHGDFDAERFAHKLLTEGFGDPEVRESIGAAVEGAGGVVGRLVHLAQGHRFVLNLVYS